MSATLITFGTAPKKIVINLFILQLRYTIGLNPGDCNNQSE